MPDNQVLEPSQEDRDAAALYFRTINLIGSAGLSEDCEDGKCDENPLVQAFARHSSSARGQGRREGREEAAKALKPFADRVFKDNGDLTVNTAPFSYDEIVAAYFAIRSLSPIPGDEERAPS